MYKNVYADASSINLRSVLDTPDKYNKMPKRSAKGKKQAKTVTSPVSPEPTDSDGPADTSGQVPGTCCRVVKRC